MNAIANASPTSPSIPFRVFDIEIAKSIEDTPGGWDGARKGLSGFACATMYDSETNHMWLYGPQDLEQLANDLEDPAVMISFNGIGFDVPVIEGILKRKLDIRSHFDLLDVLITSTGQRKGLKLDNIAQRTLGKGKSGSGAFAPVMYQAGLKGAEDGVQNIVNLLRYCALDVIILRDLVYFLQENGFVCGLNGPIHPTLPPYFSNLVRRNG